MKILIVEDEPDLRETIRISLLKEHFVVETAADYFSALDKVNDYDYDCILLDIMLPGGSGLDLLRELKRLHRSDSVLIISAKDSLDDKVEGLELGADDYLTKPYATKELIARIRSTLRRHEEPKIVADPSFNIGDLAIYPDRHEVRVGDEVVDLTKKEFDLLLFLAKNKNRVLKREEVLEKVWGYGYAGKTNIVDVYVRYLRSKIDEKVGKKYIHTVRGIGYVARD